MADTKVSAFTVGVPAVTDYFGYVAGGTANRKGLISDVVEKSIKAASAMPAQTPAANTDTYITGSNIALGTNRLQVGTVITWTIGCTKTAAGAAAPVWQIRFGTAGSTADTSRLTITGAAQSAAIDTGIFEIRMIVGTAGASGVVRAVQRLDHNLSVTGFSTTVGGIVLPAASAAFDMTTANLIVGLSVNTGASAAWTISFVMTEACGLA